jgi:hypothetical protein
MATRLSKSQLLERISTATELSKHDVKNVLDVMVDVGHKELKKNGVFLVCRALRSLWSSRSRRPRRVRAPTPSRARRWCSGPSPPARSSGQDQSRPPKERYRPAASKVTKRPSTEEPHLVDRITTPSRPRVLDRLRAPGNLVHAGTESCRCWIRYKGSGRIQGRRHPSVS